MTELTLISTNGIPETTTRQPIGTVLLLLLLSREKTTCGGLNHVTNITTSFVKESENFMLFEFTVLKFNKLHVACYVQ